MIVKDEEEMLPRCLAAAAPAVDEIVIVDTGSSDRTIEIAREFGATVIEREWTGSFADARNVSFDAATGDWLMFLDADEVLVAEDVERLRALRGRTWREAFYLTETNYTGELDDGTAVDAQRAARLPQPPRVPLQRHACTSRSPRRCRCTCPSASSATDIRVEHFGYLGAVRDAKEKSRRNIELLAAAARRRRVERRSCTSTSAPSTARVGDAQAALAEFERAWELIEQRPAATHATGFVPALAARLVRALRVCGRHEDAIARGDEALARFPGFTDLVFEQACGDARARRRRRRAARCYERCIEMGDAPSRYTATVGMGTFLPTIALAELHARARRDRPRPSRCSSAASASTPASSALVLPFAAALLADGVDAGRRSSRASRRASQS